MDWDKLVIAGAGLLAVALQLLRERAGRSGMRAQLKTDLEIVALLPDSSDVKARLQANIDERIGRMIKDESEKRRDLYSTLLGVFLLAFAAWMTTIGDRFWSFWLAPADFVALLGAVGLFQGLVPHKRDERGRIINEHESKKTIREKRSGQPPPDDLCQGSLEAAN